MIKLIGSKIEQDTRERIFSDNRDFSNDLHNVALIHYILRRFDVGRFFVIRQIPEQGAEILTLLVGRQVVIVEREKSGDEAFLICKSKTETIS